MLKMKSIMIRVTMKRFIRCRDTASHHTYSFAKLRSSLSSPDESFPEFRNHPDQLRLAGPIDRVSLNAQVYDEVDTIHPYRIGQNGSYLL